MPSEERMRKTGTGKGTRENEEIVDAIKEIMKRCDQISTRSGNGKVESARGAGRDASK
ncbi:MAG: hypothetical protein QXE45_06445 [Thermoplasmata archaeon]